MKNLTLLLVFMGLIHLNVLAVTESEPNNDYSTANLTYGDSTMSGGVCPNNEDYLKTVLPSDGTIRLIVSATNVGTNSGADFYIYAYQKAGAGTSLSKGFANVPVSTTKTDTFYIYCQAEDSFYFRIFAYYDCFSYSVKYEMVTEGTVDAEPNNSFNEAVSFLPTDTMKGHILYSGGYFSDADDYYQTVLPANGVMEVTMEYTNTSDNGGADIYLYSYQKNKGGTVGTGSKANVAAGTSGILTYKVYCQSPDTFYYRIFSYYGCFSYTMHYRMISIGTPDVEPNNTFSEALQLNVSDTATGHVSESGGSSSVDPADVYKTMLPHDGTVKYTVTAINTSNNGGADLYAYGYQKANGALTTSKSKANVPVGDTITITGYAYCQAKDSFYFKLFSYYGCFSYAITYQVIPTGTVDAEPNNDYTSAVLLNEKDTAKGHILYEGGKFSDPDDYYKTMLPTDGTIRYTLTAINTSNNGGADIYVYGYQKTGGGTAFTSSKANVPAGDTTVVTGVLHCQAADSFYFRVFSYYGCFSYELTYEMPTTGTTDAEPNNDYASAVLLNEKDTAKGHILYEGGKFSDPDDYYRTLLPGDGSIRYTLTAINTSNNGGADVYVYGYQKPGGGTAFTNSKANVPKGDTAIITGVLNCQAADSFYFRVFAYYGCFSYQLTYEILPTGTADVEPNNDRSTAATINIGDTVKGHVLYSGGKTGNDAEDFFSYNITDFGTVNFNVSAVNTSNSSGADFYFEVYKKTTRVGNTSIANVPVGDTVSATLSVKCQKADDTFYVRVYSYYGCFSYTFSSSYKWEGIITEIGASRLGNDVGFVAKTHNADQLRWNFDNGQTSTSRYPKQNFGIGTYNVQLVATNSTCNTHDTAFEFIEIKGIEYYTPDTAGTGGEMMMQVFGGGLDTTTEVMLKKGTQEIKPIAIYGSPKKNELQVILDLHTVDPGLYDVVIKISGEPAVTYSNGFEVKGLRYPYTWADVTGPDRWRINRDTRFTWVIGNTGNIKASGVVATLIWPKSVDLRFETEWFRPPSTGTYTVTTNDTAFTWKWADIQSFYDSAYTRPTPIDSFAGQPYDGYMKMIWIQHLAPGGTYEIPLIANTTSTGSPSFITYSSKPNLFGSPCPNGSWGDMSENLAVEAIDAIDFGLGLAKMDKTPVGWLAKATKATTKHMANLGQVMGATYNYATGTTNSIYESLPADFNANVDAGNAQIASEVVGLATDKLVDAGANNLMKGQTEQLNRWMANNPNASLSSFEFAIDNLNNINDLRQAVRDAYKTGKDLKSLKGKLDRLKQLAIDCPDLQKQLDDLKKEVDKEMQQREKKEKKTNSVVSMDPNAIYGPSGVGTNQYVNKEDRQVFMVTFENVDTASADAQVVVVTDTLDKAAFDLNTFEFGDVTIGKEVYRVPKGRQEFIIESDLRPILPMLVRVSAELDTATGIVEWYFVSIDPNTDDLPALDGFLPPNKTAPEGEGSVSYSVGLRSNVADGKLVKSTATITFDENEPIRTDSWENTVDAAPSTSSVTASADGWRYINIDFNGSDAQSGVDFYYLYVSEDNGPWQALTGSVENTMQLSAEPGKTYRFYSTSIDMVGNEEHKSPAAEATITISGIADKTTPAPAFIIAPNPTGGAFEIITGNIHGKATLSVQNLLGQEVLRQNVEFTTSNVVKLNLSAWPANMYLISILDENGQRHNAKLMLQR